MPARKKKSTARRSGRSSLPVQNESDQDLQPATSETTDTGSSVFSGKMIVFLAVIVILLGLVIFKKEWFVAAVVDNKPITTWELNSVLQRRFGARILDQMIDEILILQEAEKQGISVSDAEVEEKVKTVESQVGGREALLKFLDLQGMTEQDLRKQLMIKALVDQILVKNVKITDQEIADFLSKNQETLPATDAATQKKFVEEAIKEQKVAEEFQKWYEGLKNKSKIYRFY
ncbi:SurA N-terminal domain-containing protein [Candidatus Microgenomates bacterium]|nr:SurA N-terminal domain-containing protein [Candidatus Microgenomates bacterium]